MKIGAKSFNQKQRFLSLLFLPNVTKKDVLVSKTSYNILKTFFNSHFGQTPNLPKAFGPTPILFLYGPSGSGKRSTIDFLCEQFEVALATPDSLQIDDNNEKPETKDPEYVRDLFKVFNVASTWYSSKY